MYVTACQFLQLQLVANIYHEESFRECYAIGLLTQMHVCNFCVAHDLVKALVAFCDVIFISVFR
jgi:hypothetical protein